MHNHRSYDIQFVNVHKNKTPEVLDEIVTFWVDLKVLSEKAARERAPEVIFVARNKESRIIAVSTAFIAVVPNFKNYMFVYRCLIHPQNRMPGLVQELSIRSIEYLESVYGEIEPKCIGVMAKIESPRLKELRDIHTKSGLTFAGFAPDGDPIRVHFFKGAKF